MEQKHIKPLIIGLLLLVMGYLIASKALLINQDPVPVETPVPNPVGERMGLWVGEVEIPVEVRRTVEEMSLGLSFRDHLEEGTGMVFVYTKPQPVMYWMKGMRFPLDFVWIARGVVIEITESVLAPTSENPVPKTVVPAADVDMVLEVNSGFVKAKGIHVGDEVRWAKGD
jgi:uncharacterized membrane protein (UPF0127 family)